MQRRPRAMADGLLTGRMGLVLLLQGVLVGGAAFAAFAIHYGPHPAMIARARTMAFCVLVFGELLRALVARSPRRTLWQLGLFSNPYLLGALALSALLQVAIVSTPFAQPFFEAATHYAWAWLDVILLALIPAGSIEIAKGVRQVWARSHARQPSGSRAKRPLVHVS